jgi:uncharacterized protein YdaU (DUF1376 family)
MSETPFMPLWVSDFIGDTLELDAKEIGAYMLLLMAMWQHKGELPNDQKKLQRVARVGRDWPKVWASLERFFVVEETVIFNRRLSAELLKVDTKRRVNAHAGALGGRANALKNKEQTQANALATITITTEEKKEVAKATWKERGADDADQRPGESDAAPDHDSESGAQTDAIEERTGSDGGNKPDRKADKANAARGCRVPDDFWPDGKTQRVFTECGGTDLGAWTEQFVDYWRGVSGAKGTKRDWQGTARNRIRACVANGWSEPGLSAAAGRGKRGNDKPPGRQDLEDHFAAAARVGAEWGEGYEPPIRAAAGRSGGMARH